MLTFDKVNSDPTVRAYISGTYETLVSLGFTEHGFAHAGTVARTSGYILETLGFPEHDVELVKIAALLHDIGNLLNRIDHAQSGALMAFKILSDMDGDPADIVEVVAAIGNHDEQTAVPINHITAALIIGDKTDVRRSRVRNEDPATFDIHDRVNYAVTQSRVMIDEEKTLIKLELTVDTRHCSVMDYFEIFLGRMLLCRRSAEKLGLDFRLIMNNQQMM